jgi:serine/threonine protein kinase
MRIGQYEVLGELGAGNMGVVFKAANATNGRIVAIKMIGSVRDVRSTVYQGNRRAYRPALDSTRRMLLVREAREASRLHHPNIVEILDYGHHRGLLYVVMEYLEGYALNRLVSHRETIPLADRLEIVAQLCDALAFAHRNGVIHRDVKPANTFVLTTGHVKVVDFGLVARLNELSLQKKSLSGTPSYMAPETIRGEDIDARSDIWAAGVTLYELLLGKLPFGGQNPTSLFLNIINIPAPSVPPSVPHFEELNRLLELAMAKEPRNRYAAAEDFATGLRRLRALVEPNFTEASSLTRNPVIRSLQTGDNYEGLSVDIGMAELFGKVLIGRGNNAAIGPISWDVNPFLLLEFLAVASLFVLTVASLYHLPLILALIPFSFHPLVLFSRKIAAHYGGIPRCRLCQQRMSMRSKWTRYAQTDMEILSGYADCTAALKENLWQDAAKLLCVYGKESDDVTYSKSIVSLPLRYHLKFFACERCSSQAARLTTDDRVGSSWVSRTAYVEASRSQRETILNKTPVARE